MSKLKTGEQKESDRWDPSALKISQNFVESAGVKKALLTVPVRKPTRQEFVRIHPDSQYQLETLTLELKEDRELYLVDPDLWNLLPGEVVPKLLVTAINRQGVLFLWPIRLPGEDGKLDQWNHSAIQASQLASKHWVRVAANMHLGAYECFEAMGEIPEPCWPEQSFRDLLEIAFTDRYIDNETHPVIQRLRGLA